MSGPVQIRAASTQDVPDVLRIAYTSSSGPAWTEQQYRDMLPPNGDAGSLHRCLLVAESAVGVVGFAAVSALCSVVPWEAELENIAVLPACRNAGIGGALLDAALAWARTQAADRMRLEVRASNHTAQRLYASRGFLATGTRRRYYTHPDEDATCMERGLL